MLAPPPCLPICLAQIQHFVGLLVCASVTQLHTRVRCANNEHDKYGDSSVSDIPLLWHLSVVTGRAQRAGVSVLSTRSVVDSLVFIQ